MWHTFADIGYATCCKWGLRNRTGNDHWQHFPKVVHIVIWCGVQDLYFVSEWAIDIAPPVIAASRLRGVMTSTCHPTFFPPFLWSLITTWFSPLFPTWWEVVYPHPKPHSCWLRGDLVGKSEVTYGPSSPYFYLATLEVSTTWQNDWCFHEVGMEQLRCLSPVGWQLSFSR